MPAATVVVQVPAFAEPNLGETLDAIAEQDPPPGVDVSYQAWVTPETEDPDDDATFQVAADHPVFDVFIGETGKLSTRNKAHEYAVEQGGDVIVTWDADCLPTGPDVLANLVQPLLDGEAVASEGKPRKPYRNPLSVAVNALAVAEDVVRPHLDGQLSALSASAWASCGPFSEAVDQTDLNAMRQEEEFGLHDCLQATGSVVSPRGTKVIEDPRRVQWHVDKAFQRFGRPMSDWGRKRGVDTFHPRHEQHGVSQHDRASETERPEDGERLYDRREKRQETK